MSFVKHAIFVGKNAPKLDDYALLVPYILNRFDTNKLYISEGICDQLDHASPNACFGGKAALDATDENECGAKPEILSDDELKKLFESEISLVALKQFYVSTNSPIVCVLLDKKEALKKSFEKLVKFDKHFKIIVFLDTCNRLENPYMLVWRVVNNIDAKRDIFISHNCVGIDASAKGELENHPRKWALQVDCTREVTKNLVQRKLIEKDNALFEKFELF